MRKWLLRTRSYSEMLVYYKRSNQKWNSYSPGTIVIGVEPEIERTNPYIWVMPLTDYMKGANPFTLKNPKTGMAEHNLNYMDFIHHTPNDEFTIDAKGGRIIVRITDGKTTIEVPDAPKRTNGSWGTHTTYSSPSNQAASNIFAQYAAGLPPINWANFDNALNAPRVPPAPEPNADGGQEGANPNAIHELGGLGGNL